MKLLNNIHGLNATSCLSSVAIFCALTFNVIAVSNTLATTISYDDSAASVTLQSDYLGNSNGLYPGTLAAPLSSNNTVIVDYMTGSKTAPDNVFGGYVANGLSENNKVNINNGYIRGGMYGGYSSGSADASELTVRGNSITANSGSAGNLFSGYAFKGMGTIEEGG